MTQKVELAVGRGTAEGVPSVLLKVGDKTVPMSPDLADHIASLLGQSAREVRVIESAQQHSPVAN